MSKVHDAMRSLDRAQESGVLRNLVGALIDELATEVPDDPKLESVRADLTAASRSYESSRKEDLALRFYLAIRTLNHEYEMLTERLRKMERRAQIPEPLPAAHEAVTTHEAAPPTSEHAASMTVTAGQA